MTDREKMTDKEKISELISTLRKFEPGRPLKHYIKYIRFPKYKNLEPQTRVDFSFPVTALVGANGIGKSSILHALWGAPFGKSTSQFWFATALDSIAGTVKNPQRYIYGYWHEDYGDIVETRKARVGKKIDYWEPTRWSSGDEMTPVPPAPYPGKSKDRWNPVKRNVTYINMRAAIGSFDRFFYYDEDFAGSNKKEVMLRQAVRLKSIIAKGRQSYTMGRRERLFKNRPLSEQELSWISRILGRQYLSATMIKHSLYPGNRGQDLSVLFKRDMEYSEAFAGSGEIAAVKAVVDILAAPDYSLILLDEPETSLHPGGQRAFLHFILGQR